MYAVLVKCFVQYFKIYIRFIQHTKGVSAFAVILRGHQYGMSHSGIYFSVNAIYGQDNHLSLSVSMHINTDNNKQILMLSDDLGVVPWRSYVDFALVDDGGRNLHIDLIVRNALSENHPDAKFYVTRRTCMQDYSSYNGFLDGEISIGHNFFSSQGLPKHDSGVYLQQLFISDVPRKDYVCFGPVLPSEWDFSFQKPILFEGMDAAMAARYVGWINIKFKRKIGPKTSKSCLKTSIPSFKSPF